MDQMDQMDQMDLKSKKTPASPQTKYAAFLEKGWGVGRGKTSFLVKRGFSPPHNAISFYRKATLLSSAPGVAELGKSSRIKGIADLFCKIKIVMQIVN